MTRFKIFAMLIETLAAVIVIILAIRRAYVWYRSK